jgi:GT2 family glycosyltransferase
MSPQPRASIVIPLLRQNDLWLEQSVRSALVQSACSEVLTVISPSTPESNLAVLAALQRDFPSLRVIREKPDRGFPGAFNAGIAVAAASRVGFLNSDDWLLADAVAECLPFSADIVSTGLTVYAADGVTPLEHISSCITMAGYKDQPTLERKASYLSPFFLFNKKKLEEVGGLDETLGDAPGIDDYELIWTLLERGASVAVAGKRLYCYRDHEETRLTLRKKQELIRTLERIFDKHGIVGSERERLLSRHARWFGKSIQVVWAELQRERSGNP